MCCKPGTPLGQLRFPSGSKFICALSGLIHIENDRMSFSMRRQHAAKAAIIPFAAVRIRRRLLIVKVKEFDFHYQNRDRRAPFAAHFSCVY